MQRYNFVRPILIIVVAFLVNNIVENVSILLGASKEAADTIGFIAMMAAAILMFIRFNKNKRKR